MKCSCKWKCTCDMLGEPCLIKGKQNLTHVQERHLAILKLKYCPHTYAAKQKGYNREEHSFGIQFFPD